MPSRLNEKNFVDFAVQHYSNARCLSADEFFDDLARFKYVKRLLNRYVKRDDLQERLILNHIISIYNVFQIDAANTMIFYKCEEDTWSALKTFLVFLNYLPSDFKVEVPIDSLVADKLREL
jgi:hypothetical protein